MKHLCWLLLGTLLLSTQARADDPPKPDPETEARALVEGAEAELRMDAYRAALEALIKRWDAEPALRTEAQRILSRLGPGDGEAKTGPSRYRRPDPDQGRAIYSHTGFAGRTGTVSAKAFNAGHWAIKYALNENVEIGGHISVPVFLFHFGPFVRVRGQVNDWLHVGGFAQVHAVIGYENLEDVQAAFYGGGPIVSFGNPDLSLTVTAFVHGQSMKNAETTWSVVPVIALTARVHRMVKILAEGWLPFGGVRGRLWNQSGEVGGLIYGIRLFGDTYYGDISFLWPFFEDSWNLMKYMPLGIPLLNFGFSM